MTFMKKHKEEDIENIYDKDNEELEKNTGLSTGGLQNGIILLPTSIPDRPSVPKRDQTIKLPQVLVGIFENVFGGQKMLSKLGQPPVDRIDATLKGILLVVCKIYEEMQNKNE